MDRTEEPHADKKGHEYASRGQLDGLEDLLPQWIVDLKDYFERRPMRGYSPSD